MLQFKQKPIPQQSFDFIILSIVIFSFLVLFSVLILINELSVASIVFVSIFNFIMIFLIFVCFSEIERYEIYDDKIISRNLFKITNVIYLNKVKKIYITDLKFRYLYNSSKKIAFYLFDDDRMINDSKSNIKLDNNFNYAFRIYKTDKLEEFLMNILPNVEITVL